MPQRSIETPIGPVLLIGDGARLIAIRIGERAEDGAASDDVIDQAAAHIADYFAGTRDYFDLPLAPATSPRGQVLRDAMCAIAPGETLSYGTLARRIGSAPRAIGQACARNPFPIVVPCHRVIGSGGALGHYSAGAGIETKRWLLAHETKGEIWAR